MVTRYQSLMRLGGRCVVSLLVTSLVVFGSPVAPASAADTTAQANQDWIKYYGGSNDDVFKAAVVAADGSIIAVGSSDSNDGDITGNKGDLDFLLARFAADGTKLWISSFGGSGDDVFEGVALGADGTIIAVGSSKSNDGDLIANQGGTDFVVAKFALDGTKRWINTFGGTNDDAFNSVAVASNGSIYAVGETASADIDLIANQGDTDFAVAKFSSDGIKQWIKSYGGTGSDTLNAAAIAQSGEVVAVGSSTSNDIDLPGNKGDSDFVVAQFGTDGSKTFVKNWGGAGADSFESVVVAEDGYIYTGGKTKSSNSDLAGTPNHGDYDFAIGKFYVDGTKGSKGWLKSYGGSGSDSLEAIAIAAEGSIIGVGNSTSTDGDLAGSTVSGDAAVISRFNSDGSKGAFSTFGGSGSIKLQSVSLTKSGAFITAGTSAHGADNDLVVAEYTDPSFTISAVYTLNVQWAGKTTCPTMTVIAGKTTLSPDNYSVSGCGSAAGNHTITVTAKNGFVGSMNATYKIVPRAITSATVAASVKWTGKNVCPKVTVKAGSSTVSSSNYTVSGCKKNIGKHTITVKAKGNYSGSTKLTYKILPKTVKISKVKAGKATATVSWTKANSKQKITKYRVGYRLKGKTAWTYKTVKASAKSLVIKKLKKKKTYQFRVQAYKTVTEVKYYSAWSATKTAKIK